MASFDDDMTPAAIPRPGKSGKGPMIAMIVIGLALVGGLGFALYYFLGGSSYHDTEMLAYLPANTEVVLSIDVDELLNSGKVKESINRVTAKEKDPFKEMNDKLAPAGLSINDISRMVVGMNKGSDVPVVAVRFKKSFDKKKLAEVFKAEEKKEGDKTYYVDKSGQHLFFPTDKMLVACPKESFKELFDKDSSKLLISAELQNLCKKMSKGQLWVAAVKSIAPTEFYANLEEAKKGRVPYLTPELIDLVKDAKGGGFWTKLDGDNYKFGIGVMGNNDDAAGKAETALKKEIDEQKKKKIEDDALVGAAIKDMPAETRTFFTELQKSLAVSRSGAIVEVTGNFSFGMVEKAAEAYANRKREFPPPQFPSPPPTIKTAPPPEKADAKPQGEPIEPK